MYLSHFDPEDQASIRRRGIFRHYLDRIESNAPELRTSIYFDPDWYLGRYPAVVEAIAAKRWRCALHHYLCNDTPTEFDPLRDFSEAHYLRDDPNLLTAIQSHLFRNGYTHFLKHGVREFRSPSEAIDLAWYASQPATQADLEQGRAQNAFAHWLTIGAPAGVSSAEPATSKLTADHAQILAHRQAVALLPIAGRFGYRFECEAQPAVSVVLVVRNGFATTMATIASIRANTALDIELIVIDLGSADETRFIDQYVRGSKIFRFETDIGWGRAADVGRQMATGPTVLFLSSHARIAPGSIQRACDRLKADPSAGAVGGMVLEPLGIIGQAGGILWNDGSVHDYQAGRSPLDAEANFVRAVDFCSSAFLIVRSDLLDRLEGFDHACEPGYETVDLCLRVAGAGFRVLYDPSVQVIDGLPSRFTGGGAPRFLEKHKSELTRRFPPSGSVQAFARHAGAAPRTILFIDDTVPLRRIGSGFVRGNDLLRVIAGLGYTVTVFPVNGCDYDPAVIFGDMPETVEVMHSSSVDQLAAFLNGRRGYYDIIWVARTHNLGRVRPILTRLMSESALQARIILDTEAVTPHREAEQARLAGRQYDLEAAMRAIQGNADICHAVVAVTAAEAGILRDTGLSQVSVIGHMIEPRPTERGFAQRGGLLFAGAVHTPDSPNFDSLRWFVDAVLPLVEAELGWETRLTIAGYIAPGIDLGRFQGHPRVTLRGPLADLDPLYNSHRLFIAPTRYAAGAPYKVLEAASRGLPVVATEILRHELGWTHGQEILAARADDPAGFAAQILALYRGQALWQTIRAGALARLRRENDREDYTEAVASTLNPPIVEKMTQKSRQSVKMRSKTIL